MQSQVQWTTNEIPSRTWTSAIWNPERAKESLSELVPAIQMIAMHANSDEAIAEPVLQLIDWLRRRGIEPDPAGVHGLFVAMSLGRVQISRALDENPPAEFAVRFFDIRSTPSGFHFWMQAGNRDGLADAEAHDGPADELRARGFDVEVDPETGQISRIELGQKLLAQRCWEVVGRANGVILLRKPQLDPTSTKGGSGTSQAPRSDEHRAI